MEARKEVREGNAIDYNVFMDPDVEIMDADGNFPSDYCGSVTPAERFLGFVLLAFFILTIIILICEIFGNKSKVVELYPAEGGVDILDIGSTESVEPESRNDNDMYRILEGPLSAYQGKTYMIDGYDYLPYNCGNKGIRTVLNEVGYEEPKFLVNTLYNGIIDVIGSRNLYREHPENGNYSYYLYLPKPAEKVSVVNSDITFLNTVDCGIQEEVYFVTFLHGDDTVGENIPIEVSIEYEDGTEDKLEVFVTRKVG